MLTKSALKLGFKKLAKSPSPALDAEILLSHVLKKPREFLYSHPEKKLTAKQTFKFKKLISRRSQGEPIAYLTNHKKFYGLDFYVDKNVLIPRPETELLVEEALKHITTAKTGQAHNTKHVTLIDVGTGSGNIIISLVKNLISQYPNVLISSFATDISQKAINIARKNARQHKVFRQIKFLKGNLLCPVLNSKFLIFNSLLVISNLKLVIICNLPYLTKTQIKKEPSIKFEPKIALDGGPNGLALYKKLFKQINILISQYLNISLFIEINSSQTKLITNLAKKLLPTFSVEIKKDLAGLDRLMVLKNKN